MPTRVTPLYLGMGALLLAWGCARDAAAPGPGASAVQADAVLDPVAELVYIGNANNAVLTIVNPETIVRIGQFGFGGFGTLMNTAVEPAGRYLYVLLGGGTTGTTAPRVLKMELERSQYAGSLVLSADLQPTDIGVTPDGRKLFVTHFNAHSVSAIDAATMTLLKTIPLTDENDYVNGIAMAAGGREVFVASQGSGRVHVIDTGTLAVVATIETGLTSVNELALTQNGRYVLGTSPTGVVVIDVFNRQVTSLIPAPGAAGIAIPASGNEAYVAHGSSMLLSVIDTRTLSVVATVALSGIARRIGVNTSGRFAIVTLSGGGASLIDLATRTVVGTADVAPGAWGVTFVNGPRRNLWKPLYAYQAAITAGGTGYVAVEGGGTLPLAELPGGHIAGTAVAVGYACNGDVLTSDPAGKIAIIERGPLPIACSFSEKFANVVTAGAIAGIVYNDTRANGGYETLVNMATGPVPIPGVFVRRSTGLALLAGAPLQVTLTTCGESMSCRGALLDWLNW